jgi:type I restriction enzyme S subunit
VSNGWPLVPMEDIFEIARGGSPRPIDSFLTDDPDGVNWVMISDATESGKYINSTKKRIREEGVKRSRVVQPGDFLLTNSMSFGRPYIMNTSGCIHDGWLVLSPRNQNVSPDFFYHLLGSDFVYAEFVRRAAGATVKNLNIDLVKGVQVPLPPMPEQRRIAEVLDRADALRAKRRAALSQLDTLTQSIFLDIVGDPSLNRKSWRVLSLREICSDISDIDHKMPDGVDEGVPFISAKDLLDDGRLSFENVKRISEDDFRRLSRKSKPARGDIIYSRIGVNLGKARLVEVDFDFLASYSCCTVKPNRTIVDQRFLCSVLDSPFILRQAHKGVRAIAVPDLGMNEIKNFRIPVPPMHVQSEFTRCVAAVSDLRVAQRSSLAKLDALFATLQHRAFRGEL